MKNYVIYLGIFMCNLFLLSSCEKDNDDSDVTMMDVVAIKSVVSSGEWRITYYFDTDKDETQDYTGFVFSFNSDGGLEATNGDVSHSGVWSVTNSDNSNDDNSDGNDVHFNILYAAPEKFEELSEDWHIITYSDTKIELIDVSGGNGGTDYLTFEKI